MMTSNNLSFQNQIQGAVANFLTDAGIHGPETRDGIVHIIDSLSRYQEEGQRLYPRVIITESIAELKVILPQCEYLCIGQGVLSAATYRSCLKKCAPLATRDWYVCIEKGQGLVNYGLMRSGDSALSELPEVKIQDDPLHDVPVVIIRQIAEGTVEAVASNGHTLIVNMSARELSEIDRRSKLSALFTKISSGIDPSERSKLELILTRAFSDALERGHGMLVAVLAHDSYSTMFMQRTGIWQGLQDGTWLNPPIDLLSRIRTEMGFEDRESSASTWAAIEAVSGMLMCDGITVFDNLGQVVGFNIFARSIESAQSATLESNTGGARRRAFTLLKSWLDQGIIACLVVSQDGAVEMSEMEEVAVQ